jgi:F0F1-type ATP synthase membrane subunit b/b'
MLDAENRAEKRTDEIRIAAQAETEELRAAAEKKLENIAELIVERVVK